MTIDYVFCNIAVHADDRIFYAKCELPYDLWQQPEWTSELELTYGTLDWDRKWLVDFNAGKIELFSFG